MVRIRVAHLPHPTGLALASLQSQINLLADYPERVKAARQRFEAENRVGNEVFEVVRHTLSSMCSGACRCMYCEDSAASEVEHFRPKTFYPEMVFEWLNFLYACGPCNRIKRSHFRLLVGQTDSIDLRRGRTDPVVAPPVGSTVLIDPQADNPSEFMSIDLQDTFWFVPRHGKGTPEYERASYTITRLKLNHRDFLPQSRKAAYVSYRARLREYIGLRGTPGAQLLANAIARYDHPSVWAEMKAQADIVPELALLFAEAPEARTF